ncbi:N-acetylmannosamine kinase [Photobacterium aphoticum]|uniref:N-acetylmannosamine kinase n=1 Tax=Photobacterium aphoticum TaxID=754436 RepID=A0A0J1GKA1_9GAMM|nr:N-acetylmannosamine kinase [Photobacterium aphoticum]KLV00125.1 N-acetylmannosamine kinase [Photobacterium aphoticum]PSU57211.1 N-acetylmannosamine kinase [Photobacterium aphoticum]GHA48918.1 N-acetylmannosamine kinase [Photobacterium aphoticum]
MSMILAVDIGGTKIAVALVSNGQIRAREQISTPSSSSPEAMTAALSALLPAFAAQADAVAVASTGIIDHGILTALNPKNLGGLDHYPLQAVIAEITRLPVTVINDAQAAAWAEYQVLPEQVANMAFVTVSTGVGAGVVINHALHTGRHGIAGHAGHMLADPHGPRCGCGRTGCVEAIASGTAIGVAGQAHWGENCTGQTVYEHYLQGDERAVVIIHRAAKTIANLVADLTISLDVEVVALGGSVGLAPGFLDLVSDYLSDLPQVYQPLVIKAQTGADAGLIGAASWVNTTNNA